MPANFGDDLLSSKSNRSVAGLRGFFAIIVKPIIFKCVIIAFSEEKNPLLGNYSVTNDFFENWQLNMQYFSFTTLYNGKKYVSKNSAYLNKDYVLQLRFKV